MNSAQRLLAVLEKLSGSDTPVSGSVLSKEFGVSRQIIVKDIASLKEQGHDIIATTKGYILHRLPQPERVFKVVHGDDDIERELSAIVAEGGVVKDVFVWHKIYGKIEAALNVKSMNDIAEYIKTLKNGRSSPLKNVTNEYHYHTVIAESNDILDKISEKLDDLGYLVYED